MNKLDRMVSAVDPAAAFTEPSISQGVHDLLEEIVATPPAPRRGRSPLRRPLLAGAAVAGLAAAALVAVPVISLSPAYAVVKNSDGTVQVTVNELRDPEGLEAKLKAEGITADVTYTEAGKQCARGRFVGADLAYDPPNPQNMTEQERKEADKPDNWRSRDVAAPINQDTFVISPRFMRPEETLVLEFRPGNHPGVGWAFLPYLAKAGSTVAPCRLVNANSDGDIAKELAGN
ncbi:hypothetical protein [Nonomuraea sp. NEAU-A123]|uniref:hypothetical protein n=1 Tax=Nonomuraea sp. NEAU-A123 TaxID=2839649 RepID=UPI001BE3D307|nr:hypothetical protein [Nonomuraea sp. NEAU-A123]MBT2224906.1 hypothetical protein [Nonomuraea sp. NEAU-A123]